MEMQCKDFSTNYHNTHIAGYISYYLYYRIYSIIVGSFTDHLRSISGTLYFVSKNTVHSPGTPLPLIVSTHPALFHCCKKTPDFSPPPQVQNWSSLIWFPLFFKIYGALHRLFTDFGTYHFSRRFPISGHYFLPTSVIARNPVPSIGVFRDPII